MQNGLCDNDTVSGAEFVGVLTEVAVMLTLVKIANHLKGDFHE